MYRVFDDRRDAGLALVPAVQRCHLKDPIVLGLARGGVPVAKEVAAAFDAPLDALVVRKLGAPLQPELAIGAIASGGIRVLNEKLVSSIYGLNKEALDEIVASETQELHRREEKYRGGRPHAELANRDVLLVDDGMATGATMRAAVESVRTREPSRILVAVPTASEAAVKSVAELADDVICLETPSEFYAVGQFYRRFPQTTDDEVRELLDKAQEASVIGV